MQPNYVQNVGFRVSGGDAVDRGFGATPAATGPNSPASRMPREGVHCTHAVVPRQTGFEGVREFLGVPNSWSTAFHAWLPSEASQNPHSAFSAFSSFPSLRFSEDARQGRWKSGSGSDFRLELGVRGHLIEEFLGRDRPEIDPVDGRKDTVVDGPSDDLAAIVAHELLLGRQIGQPPDA
jgi:hypothetical protein